MFTNGNQGRWIQQLAIKSSKIDSWDKIEQILAIFMQ
jgi:hypothetical protein